MARRIQRQPVTMWGVTWSTHSCVPRRHSWRRTAVVLLSALLTFAATPPLTPDQQALLKHISPASLKDHLTYLASDALEGRATPSRGLDAAAEYIATEFRRAGLEPAAANGSFYQTATLMVREPNYEDFDVSITSGAGAKLKTLRIDPGDMYLSLTARVDLNGVLMIVVDGTSRPTQEQVEGKVVLLTAQAQVRGLAQMKPALVLRQARELPTSQVFDPDGRPPVNQALIAKAELSAFVKDAQNLRLNLHARASKDHPADARNVAGILRGSDPTLKNTFVMLTAHYDHLGAIPESRGASGDDHIFNGANDDGSGTVSVMEIASALAAMPRHPARSILFMTFFGEERGLLGSAFYARHPLVSPADTIADLNLEQVGRTDSGEGPQTTNVSKTATITGFDFSDLSRILADAAAPAGIKIYKDEKRSDQYFEASDNLTLAALGIPAHSICVAFEFPDYHKVSDSADKIDYANMAAVDGAVSLGLLRLASSAPPPKWNESYAPARRYADLGKQLHP
jgi:hypothetical protein